MAHSRFALWLLDQFNSDGAREALIGDLVEEIAQGRSSFWVWQQVLAVGGLAVAVRVRSHAPETAHLIALALGLFLLGGAWIAPSARLLETWAIVYLVIGTCSLFGDMMSPRSVDSRSIVFPLNTVLRGARPTR
jgi:hypothetical protein